MTASVRALLMELTVLVTLGQQHSHAIQIPLMVASDSKRVMGFSARQHATICLLV